jgi:Ni/Fe-hydrogenase subunit HybB-like protein
MFLEDELEYVRLKRADNIMGWLAIIFVAALVFMFAGLMNTASATGAASAPHASHALVQSGAVSPAHLHVNAAFADTGNNIVILDAQMRDLATDPMPSAVSSEHTSSIPAHRPASHGDREVLMGLMAVSFVLMGGSFVVLAFGGPRRQPQNKDQIDTL